MGSKKQEEIISEASYHTIKKFELIENYVSAWAPKLLNNSQCNKLVFIDCMCNSGEYINKESGEKVFGTPVRVARKLAGFAKDYPNKKIYLIFNDYNQRKIEHLTSLLTMKISNLYITFSVKDGNVLLNELSTKIIKKDLAYLLVYDPYEATIDWNAIYPYLNGWGEVIINHMLYDSARAVKVVKSEQAVKKYEATYLTELQELMPYGSDKKKYENRVEEIITKLRKSKKYYIASFPFFNSKNSIVYDLIHCTNSSVGFALYKQVAWKVFGGKSSTKDIQSESSLQMAINLDSGEIDLYTNEDCFQVSDIAKYLNSRFAGQKDVPINDLWELLKIHPVFPADGYRKEIKRILKSQYNTKLTKKTISFVSKE